MKSILQTTLHIILLAIMTMAVKSQHWAEINGWSFDNFTQPDFDWDLFRETFIGVAQTQASSANFDNIIFDEIYKTLPNDGHCYGINLLALMMLKHGGYLGYCHPPHVYAGSPAVGPTDPQLRRAIQLMHGQQLTHRFLLFLLDIIAVNKNRDGNYAYAQFEYYRAKDDPCIISVTESLNPDDGGHALIAYDVLDLGATKRILIWDPNRSYYESPADKIYYDSGSNFIEVTTASGAWSFIMADGTTWSGHPGGGGNIVTLPLSVAGKRDRLPQSLFADIADALTKIFVYADDAEIEQITDGQGRRLFIPGTHEPDTNAVTGMRNVMPFIPMTGNSARHGRPKIYFHRGNDPIEITVNSRSSGYRLDVLGEQGYISLTSVDGHGIGQLGIAGIHSATPEISFRSEAIAVKHKLEIHSLSSGDTPIRIYRMENLELDAGRQVELRLIYGGEVLEIQSRDSELSYDLKLQSSTKERAPEISQRIQMSPGEKLQIRPQHWHDLQKGRLKIRRK
jgi:hypothetical protein